MGIPTTGPAVKNHISPKRARELIVNVSENVHTRPGRLEDKLVDVSLATLVHVRGVVVSSVPHGQRAGPSATAASLRLRCVHDFRRRGSSVFTVNDDVPLDCVLVWVAVRCPSFVLWFCGAAVQTPRDSGVVCTSLLQLWI